MCLQCQFSVGLRWAVHRYKIASNWAKNWHRRRMFRLNFVPIRSDPRIIFLSGNQPLPGMMLLPGSFSGRDNSPRPHRGPEPRKRISLAIFIRLQAITFRAPCNSTIASWAANASNLFGALEKHSIKRSIPNYTLSTLSFQLLK